MLARMLEVLTAVAAVERAPARLQSLQRHVDLVVGDARRRIGTPADLGDILQRADHFHAMRRLGPLAALSKSNRATAA